MAGADGQRLWDISRRAASFLRMARLALTGGSPAQLLAEEDAVGGYSCDPYYKSISTEEELESGELWLEEDESEQLVDGEDGSTTMRAAGGGDPLNKKSLFIRHRPATAGAVAAAVAESVEPLMPRPAAKRANDAEMVHHPFGCDRRGSESSSLLLVSSS